MMIAQYDSLIDENSDPIFDPEPLREYLISRRGRDRCQNYFPHESRRCIFR